MATPTRKLILDDIQSTLEGITVAGGYKTTVATVEANIKDWGSVPPSNRPWIGYMPRRTVYDYMPGGYIRATMPILLVCHLISTTEGERSDDIANAIDDVIAALNADQSRGGNAVSTTVKTTSDDLGDPDAEDMRSGYSSTFDMEIDIVYLRTSGST